MLLYVLIDRVVLLRIEIRDRTKLLRNPVHSSSVCLFFRWRAICRDDNILFDLKCKKKIDRGLVRGDAEDSRELRSTTVEQRRNASESRITFGGSAISPIICQLLFGQNIDKLHVQRDSMTTVVIYP
jgi:hypothetical protein